jgi:hypothetical protein
MAQTKRLFKSFYRLFLPVIVLLLLAIVAASIGFIYKASHPPTAKYLVTPEKYGRFSARGARVTRKRGEIGTARPLAAGSCAARKILRRLSFFTVMAPDRSYA